MFKWCNLWCRYHNYCLNTTNGECRGVAFPEEEQTEEDSDDENEMR